MQNLSILENIIVFTLLGSVGALIIAFILIADKKLAQKIAPFLASFAAGILLGAAFLDLLPEAAHEAQKSGANIFLWALVGLVLFFLIERFFHWFHHHEQAHEHEREVKSTIPLIIISDTLHNFIDGVIIAATFLISIPLGVATTLAVIAHEVPQEIGDVGLLLHKGLSRVKVIGINLLSAIAALVGAVGTYLLGDIFEPYIPVLLALTAGFFIYIASSDLIPEIHYEKNKKYALIKSGLLLLGIFVMWMSVSFLQHGQ